MIPIAPKIISKGSASDLYLRFPSPIPVAKIIITILEIIKPYILRLLDCIATDSPKIWINLDIIIKNSANTYKPIYLSVKELENIFFNF